MRPEEGVAGGDSLAEGLEKLLATGLVLEQRHRSPRGEPLEVPAAVWAILRALRSARLRRERDEYSVRMQPEQVEESDGGDVVL
jgi:hypothetical protein